MVEFFRNNGTAVMILNETTICFARCILTERLLIHPPLLCCCHCYCWCWCLAVRAIVYINLIMSIMHSLFVLAHFDFDKQITKWACGVNAQGLHIRYKCWQSTPHKTDMYTKMYWNMLITFAWCQTKNDDFFLFWNVNKQIRQVLYNTIWFIILSIFDIEWKKQCKTKPNRNSIYSI